MVKGVTAGRTATVRVIVVCGRKGGVGKTTTVIQLARSFARRGLRVLVIDTDDQAAASYSLNGGDLPEDVATLADVIGHRPALKLAEVVQQTRFAGIDLVPASESLAALEIELGSASVGRESRLREALTTVDDGTYDIVLIDTPPSLGLLSISALTAADTAQVVGTPTGLSNRMADALLDSIDQVRSYLRPDLTVMPILLTQIDARDPIHVARAAEIRRALAGNPGVLDIEIPLWRTIARAVETGSDLTASMAPASRKAAALYDALAEALLPSADYPGTASSVEVPGV